MSEEQDREPLEVAEIKVRQLARMIGKRTPKGWGFVLVMLTHGPEGCESGAIDPTRSGWGTYISSFKDRKAVAQALREMAGYIDEGDEL